MSFVAVHVFAAGSDANASIGDPRRFNISLDGHGPLTAGWTKVMDFQAYNTPVENTMPVYVSDAGSAGPKDPHRFLVDRAPGASRGFRDLFAFYAFLTPVAGTMPFYVMQAADANCLRSEISVSPTPQPGWALSFAFHAFPSPASHLPPPPPQNPAYAAAPVGAAPAYPIAAMPYGAGPAAPPSYTEATGHKAAHHGPARPPPPSQKAPAAGIAVAQPVRQTTTVIHQTRTVHHPPPQSTSVVGSTLGFLSALGKTANDVMYVTGLGGASPQSPIYISHTGFPPSPGPHCYRVSYTRNDPGWMDLFALRVFTTSHSNTMPVYVSKTGGSPRTGPLRFRVSNDGPGTRHGWCQVMKFYAFSYPAPGSVPVYVCEAGGSAHGDPHRYRLSLMNDGPSLGWRPSLTFHAYPQAL